MTQPEPTAPRWIIARLGDDLNWWVDETSNDIFWPDGGLSVLDPRQVAHMVTSLNDYRAHGCRPEQFAGAFHAFALESELSDGRVRLAATNESVLDTGNQLFALPRVVEEGEGPYFEFLDTLNAARIRQLNATHHYARPCTEEEMSDELDAIDNDRYFNATAIHAFEELNEILQWQPAEWDDPGV